MGSWWQGKNHQDQDEIDIIGLYAEEKLDLSAYSLHIFHTEISHFNIVFRKHFISNYFNFFIEIVWVEVFALPFLLRLLMRIYHLYKCLLYLFHRDLFLFCFATMNQYF